jgi:glycosyltransferase involved in cell wall biosynthesis
MDNSSLPLVSVIIPCFNLEKVIGKCIESIAKQTYKNIEIIVVNDGSTDGSQRLIETFALSDKRIIPVKQPNRGVGAAYNRGLRLAKGQYVYIIDGDNYADEDLLERLYGKIQEFNCDAVICDYYIENYNGGAYEKAGLLGWEKLLMPDKKTVADNAFKLYKAYILQSPCNKLYKKELIKGLFFEENRAFMMIVDSDFNVRLLDRLQSAVSMNEPLVHYVQYELTFRKQITSMWKYKYEKKSIECEKRLYLYFKNYYLKMDKIAALNEINNYFAGRFLKIAQVLCMDKKLSPQEKEREIKYLQRNFQELISEKAITYFPYRFLYKLLIKEQVMLLNLIYRMLDICSAYLPKIFKMMKAG